MKHVKTMSLEKRIPQPAKGCCGGIDIYLGGGLITAALGAGAYALVKGLSSYFSGSTCDSEDGCTSTQIYPSKGDY